MDPDHIRALFLQELEEQTGVLSRGVLALEEQELSSEVVDDVFRAAHSLKGAAQVTGTRAVADVAHGVESVLGAIRARTLAADAQVVTALLGAVDWFVQAAAVLASGNDPDARQARNLRTSLNRLAEAESEAAPFPRGGQAPQPGEAAPMPRPARSADSVRVAATKLDALLRQASEITVARQRLESVRGDVTRAARAVADHDAQWRRLRRALDASESIGGAPEVVAALERTESTWRAAAGAVEPLAGKAAAAERDLRQAAVPLVDQILDLRTMPFAEVCEGLGRTVRDAARRSGGKEVALNVQGEGVELDRSVALALRDPLIHLVHNAVDHGIETAAARRDAGKPAVGQITLAAEVRGDRVQVVVRDDGAGLQPDAIRDAAVRSGLGELDSEEELIGAVFTPGLSTATAVTDTSGRGVGLDAVRARVDALGGSVALASKPGAGTTVILLAPITLSIMHTISVAVADQIVMLSSTGVLRAIHVPWDEVRTVAGRPTIVVDDRHVPLVDLAEVLGWPPDEEPAHHAVPTLVIEAAGAQMALRVSALLGEGEATVHGIGERIGAAPAVVGTTLLPDGGIAVILSAVACARLAAETSTVRALRPVSTPEAFDVAARILLAEDTMTTRVLEQGILEAAGFEVMPAVDGADAWRQLRERGANLVVSDVNMPGMDGFELCAAIRSSRRFADLPVVLVTSLANEDDRRRGLEAGANAYIVKSGFDQGVLLETIERLLP